MSWKETLISFFMFGIIFAVRIKVISVYILVPVAGMCLFMILNYIAEKINNFKIQRMAIWLSRYSFPIFLMHHILLNMILAVIPPKSLDLGSMLMLFIAYVITAVFFGVVMKKIESIIINTKRGIYIR